MSESEQPKHPGGRPTDYDPEFCQVAATLCANGATDEEIADHFEVSVRTLYRWKNSHPEFCQALKAGKELADDRVERSLYMKAIGFRQKAVKIFMPAGADKPVYAEYMEHFAPDTQAAQFWLKNRRPEQWRDKQQVEHSGSLNVKSEADEAKRKLAALATAGSGAGVDEQSDG